MKKTDYVASKWKIWDNTGKMTPSQMNSFYTEQLNDVIFDYRMTMIYITKALESGDKERLNALLFNLELIIESAKIQKENSGTYAKKWGGLAAYLAKI